MRSSFILRAASCALIVIAAPLGCSDDSIDVAQTTTEPDADAPTAIPAIPGPAATGDAGEELPPKDAGHDAALPPRPIVVASSKDLGFLSAPPHVVGRDGGASCGIGGKVLWTFGDTLLNPQSSDKQRLRSNTAALAELAKPTKVSEPLDPSGAPYPFIPFTAAEKAYNTSTGKGDDRYALWVNSLIPDGASGCLAFFSKVKIGAGQLNYKNAGAGIARVSSVKTTSSRDPNLLFSPADPSLSAVLSDGGYVYVYMSRPDHAIIVGRAPLSQVAMRAAYEFFDGASWQPDPRKGKATGLAFLSSLSVAYNPYLRAFFAVGSAIFSRDIVGFTAPSPTGPWSAATKIFTGMAPASGTTDYAGIQHPALALDNGRTVRLTYYHPSGTFTGELRLTEVTLK